MENFKTTEKLIIVFFLFVAVLLFWMFNTARHSNQYAGINCPKCGSERVIMTHRDVIDVDHLLCLDCLLKMTMTDVANDSINNVKINSVDDCKSVASEEMLDSLYDPELECPDLI